MTGFEPVTRVEEGCTCGGVGACQQCQERDAALAAWYDTHDAVTGELMGNRFRVTIRGEGTEIRGYATGEALAALADDASDPFIVVASVAEDDYDPFEAQDAIERVRELLDWPVGRDTGGVDRLIPASEVRAAIGERP